MVCTGDYVVTNTHKTKEKEMQNVSGKQAITHRSKEKKRVCSSSAAKNRGYMVCTSDSSAAKKRGYMVCTSDSAAEECKAANSGTQRKAAAQIWKKKKRGYRVCSSGYAATDTS
jgi:hypothetical protein